MSDSKSDDTPIRILAADDHELMRAGLVAIINMQPDMKVVAEAANGEEACELFNQCRPDITLTDLKMPKMEGLGLIKHVRGIDKHAKIIVLTTFDGDEDIYRSLKAGAKGYLMKDTPRGQLIDAIRAVQKNEQFISSHIAQILSSSLDREHLTPRELEILGLIAEGFANKQIGSRLGITEGTVKTHVNSIMQKLRVGGRTEAVVSAARRGFIRL
jgi:two-component system NarL family response regulator